MSNKVGSSIGIRLIEGGGVGGRSMFDNDAKYVNSSYIFNPYPANVEKIVSS